jgi:acetyl esterase/lipase
MKLAASLSLRLSLCSYRFFEEIRLSRLGSIVKYAFLLSVLIAVTVCAHGQAAPAAPTRPATEHPPAIPGPPPSDMTPNPAKHPTIQLYPKDAPGSEGMSDQPEKYRVGSSIAEGNDDILIISNINKPSITVYLPHKDLNTGAAFIVAPGGGFSEEWITPEGYRVADWLSQHGIAAFVLKYRLPKDVGSKYTMDDAVADMQRAIRTVKSRAAEWGVDPDRVGVIGFSAGGALSGMASARFNDPVKNPVDDIDKLSAKPAFEALIYGAPFTTLLGQPATPVTRDLPPTFMACGGSDPISQTYPDIYKTLKAAGVPVELHIYGGVSHGFGIQEFTPLNVSTWPDRLRDWMAVSGFLTKH